MPTTKSAASRCMTNRGQPLSESRRVIRRAGRKPLQLELTASCSLYRPQSG
jgi:hypothetical protein